MPTRRKAGCNGCGKCPCCIKNDAGVSLGGTGDDDACFLLDRWSLIGINGNIVAGPVAGAGGRPVWTINETITALTGTQPAGHAIGTYTNEAGAAVTLNESVSTLVRTAGTNTYTFTNENGVAVVFDTNEVDFDVNQVVVGTTDLTWISENGNVVTWNFATAIAATYGAQVCPLPADAKVLVYSASTFPGGALVPVNCVRWGQNC